MKRDGSWRLGWLSGLISLSVAASACSSATAPAPSGGPSAGAPTTPTGEFRVNLASEPPSLDPTLSNWAQSTTVIRQLFAGMFRFSPQGEVTADLAKEVPSVANGGISSDGKKYTFKLKDGLKWSDGKALTAEDFAYSLRRLLHPKTPSEYASFFYDIKGAEPLNEALGTKEQPKQVDDATLAKMVEGLGVKATDATTLVIELERSRPTFLQVMGLWPSFPLRKDIIEAKGDKWTEAGNLIGNGPFVMDEWKHQDHITLSPNPNWHGEKAKLAKMTFYMVSDSNANFAAYKAGERDMTEVPTALAKQVLADPSVKDEILRYTDLATFAYQFNVKKAPFDNVKVRQALSKAINRTAFVDKVSSGIGKPAVSWIPPGMPGYDPSLGATVNAFDPAAAKKLLADAGFPGGAGLPSIAIQYANAASNQLRGEFLQGQLKENLGIDIKLEPMESSAFAKAVNDYQFQVAFYGWGADYPDPDNWLPEVFGSKGSQNHTQYSSAKFDDLASKAANELDPAKRLALWIEAQKVVVEDTPVIFLIHRERFLLKKPYVKDLTTTGMTARYRAVCTSTRSGSTRSSRSVHPRSRAATSEREPRPSLRAVARREPCLGSLSAVSCGSSRCCGSSPPSRLR
ncbi:MAG: peptide ABC transporter substrate-binding protein [Chloroflexi bacterium]|nr:peptide ABC transporter substrate-binding protein [Chloroflexota bacterium]